MTEHDDQAALMAWAATRLTVMPELEYLFSVPNAGKRGRKARADMLAEGLHSGVPDLFLPCARAPYHGFFIEMKAPAGRVTANQARWLLWLTEQGYRTAVCRSWHDAARLIENYLQVAAEKRTEFYSD